MFGTNMPIGASEDKERLSGGRICAEGMSAGATGARETKDKPRQETLSFLCLLVSFYVQLLHHGTCCTRAGARRDPSILHAATYRRIVPASITLHCSRINIYSYRPAKYADSQPTLDAYAVF